MWLPRRPFYGTDRGRGVCERGPGVGGEVFDRARGVHHRPRPGVPYCPGCRRRIAPSCPPDVQHLRTHHRGPRAANGIFIEGVQVQLPTRVRPEQEVQIGSARLTFVCGRIRTPSYPTRCGTRISDWGPFASNSRARNTGHHHRGARWHGGDHADTRPADSPHRRDEGDEDGRPVFPAKTCSASSTRRSSPASSSIRTSSRFTNSASMEGGDFLHDEVCQRHHLGRDPAQTPAGRSRDARARYSLGTLLTIFQKVSDAVAYAHSRGVVHRDLKPENVMIGTYGEVLVMDWGLAKKMNGGRGENPDPTRRPRCRRLTPAAAVSRRFTA